MSISTFALLATISAMIFSALLFSLYLAMPSIDNRAHSFIRAYRQEPELEDNSTPVAHLNVKFKTTKNSAVHDLETRHRAIGAMSAKFVYVSVSKVPEICFVARLILHFLFIPFWCSQQFTLSCQSWVFFRWRQRRHTTRSFIVGPSQYQFALVCIFISIWIDFWYCDEWVGFRKQLRHLMRVMFSTSLNMEVKIKR